MSVSVADVVNRAAYHNVANAATTLTSNTSEMIAKVGAFEQDVFTEVAKKSRFFWASFDGVSTTGSAHRTLDTATIGNVERIVRVNLTDSGTQLNPVDYDDVWAEIAPRYYVLGTVLTEVDSDWGAAGTVNITVGYAKAPVPLDPTGSALQTITLPDKYADLLSIRMAGYLALKDMESRDPAEVGTLDTLYSGRLGNVIESLGHFPGFVKRRFPNPNPYPEGSDG
jgi:hypothetical protein